MTKLFSLDVNLVGTVYIKADSAEIAMEIAQGQLFGEGLEFSSRYDPIGDNICMDGRPFNCLAENDEDMAFSPAMTIANCQDVNVDDLEECDFEPDDD